VGLLLPLAMSLAMALGDAVGGKRILVGSAMITLAGVTLIALGGLMAKLAPPAAPVLVVAGALLVPAAIRFGDLLGIHATRGHYSEQLRIGRILRALLVVAIYGPVLVAGSVAERVGFGWAWVFAGYALLLGAMTPMLVSRLPSDSTPTRAPMKARRASGGTRAATARTYTRELAGIALEPRMLWAGAAIFLARMVVFGYVAGLAVVLAAQWDTATIRGFDQRAAILAAPIVAVNWQSQRSFAAIAGVIPITALLTLEVTRLGSLPPTLTIAAFAVASVGVEASKQNSQLLTMIQAREGRPEQHAVDFRAQAILNLWGNLGAVAGTWFLAELARRTASAWDLALLMIALVVWALQASWFWTRRRGRHHRAPRRGRHGDPTHGAPTK
jgi:hypothetical protein